MSQCQLNFNCQISFTHQAAKQNNPVDCIAGALLAFFRQGIEQKKSSLLLVPLHHYCNRCGQVTFAVGRLSATRYKKANWSTCRAGYIMGKLCEINLTNLSDFQHHHFAILRAQKPTRHQIMI